MEEDGIPEGYIRVSDVLKIFKSFEGIDPAVLANASDRGSRVHAYCEAYALNEFIGEYDDDCKGYMASFIPWFDQNVDKVIANEKRINDAETGLSGKFDMVVTLKDGSTTLIDFKTPARACLTWELQMAAYRLIATPLIPIEKSQVIQLSKEGKGAKVIEYKNYEKSRTLFLQAVEIYKFLNPNKPFLHKKTKSVNL